MDERTPFLTHFVIFWHRLEQIKLTFDKFFNKLSHQIFVYSENVFAQVFKTFKVIQKCVVNRVVTIFMVLALWEYFGRCKRDVMKNIWFSKKAKFTTMIYNPRVIQRMI